MFAKPQGSAGILTQSSIEPIHPHTAKPENREILVQEEVNKLLHDVMHYCMFFVLLQFIQSEGNTILCSLSNKINLPSAE